MGPLVVIGDAAGAAGITAKRAGYQPVLLLPEPRAAAAASGGRAAGPVHAYRGQSPASVLPVLERICPPDTPVLLTGPMENHDDIVRAIAMQYKLLGSGPDAMAAVRRPGAWMDLPPTSGLRLPQTLQGAGLLKRLTQLAVGRLGRRTLIKPIASYGGVGIEKWNPLSRVGKQHYLQQWVRGGTPMSGVYFADGWSAQLLGVTEQLVGEPALGAAEFGYCGSIGPVTLSKRAREALAHLGVVLTQRFDLRGVFGVDVVVDWLGRVWPVEVNPRYPHSVPVLEAALGVNVLLGRGSSAQSTGRRGRDAVVIGQHGQAYVFARQAGVLSVPQIPADEATQTTVLEALPEGTAVQQGDWLASFATHGKNRDVCFDALCKAASPWRRAVRDA